MEELWETVGKWFWRSWKLWLFLQRCCIKWIKQANWPDWIVYCYFSHCCDEFHPNFCSNSFMVTNINFSWCNFVRKYVRNLFQTFWQRLPWPWHILVKTPSNFDGSNPNFPVLPNQPVKLCHRSSLKRQKCRFPSLFNLIFNRCQFFASTSRNLLKTRFTIYSMLQKSS